MTSLPIESSPALISGVRVGKDVLVVELSDGRVVSVPLVWYPRLLHGTPSECSEWRLIGHGKGVHWPSLDEDIAVDDVLAGRRSGESPESLGRWLESRKV